MFPLRFFSCMIGCQAFLASLHSFGSWAPTPYFCLSVFVWCYMLPYVFAHAPGSCETSLWLDGVYLLMTGLLVYANDQKACLWHQFRCISWWSSKQDTHMFVRFVPFPFPRFLCFRCFLQNSVGFSSSVCSSCFSGMP